MWTNSIKSSYRRANRTGETRYRKTSPKDSVCGLKEATEDGLQYQHFPSQTCRIGDFPSPRSTHRRLRVFQSGNNLLLLLF